MTTAKSTPPLWQGKKTYIVAALGAVVAFAQTVGWITQDMANTILGFLAALGLATLRQAVGAPKQEPPAKD